LRSIFPLLSRWRRSRTVFDFATLASACGGRADNGKTIHACAPAPRIGYPAARKLQFGAPVPLEVELGETL
jgi:hypothetical protein